jgi:SAM-dependent methyltransferase
MTSPENEDAPRHANDQITLRSLLDVVRRSPSAGPWEEGDNIPWHEPGFSERMLEEHLSQEHDAASRRSGTIDAHVKWIHQRVLDSRPARVLDLGCGPGLYASRLARLGHECVGIDYSPASIRYATDHARTRELSCRYTCDDIRQAEYGTGFGLAMLIFGELNVFHPSDATAVLQKVRDALRDGGVLLLEPHTEAVVEKIGAQSAHWYSRERGLFSERPHLCLQEHLWDEASRTATIRYFIVDAESAAVSRYAQSFQAYSDDEYRSLLVGCGFEDVEILPSLGGTAGEPRGDLVAVVAKKPAR